MIKKMAPIYRPEPNPSEHGMHYLHRANFPAICNMVKGADYAGYAVDLKQAQGCGIDDSNTSTSSRRCAQVIIIMRPPRLIEVPCLVDEIISGIMEAGISS